MPTYATDSTRAPSAGRRSRGFTLLELIAVVVILGIIAVTAVPYFLDIRTDAKNNVRINSAAEMAASLNNALLKNYIGNAGKGPPWRGTEVRHCQDTNQLARVLDPSNAIIQGDGVGHIYYYSPTGEWGMEPGWIFATGGSTTVLGTGETRTCSVSKDGHTFDFTLYGCGSSCAGP